MLPPSDLFTVDSLPLILLMHLCSLSLYVCVCVLRSLWYIVALPESPSRAFSRRKIAHVNAPLEREGDCKKVLIKTLASIPILSNRSPYLSAPRRFAENRSADRHLADTNVWSTQLWPRQFGRHDIKLVDTTLNWSTRQ